MLKPFVFLDFLSGDVRKEGLNFGFHPHSGIGTLTYSITAAVHYVDTEGISGVLEPGGLEWMQAGGGTWHKSSFKGSIQGLMAFQFWLALPPVVEDGPSHSLYIAPVDVPTRGGLKVLLGEYEGMTSPIKTPTPVNVIDVSLTSPDEVYRYTFPIGHLTGFVHVYQGAAQVGDDPRESTPGEVFVLDNEGEYVELRTAAANTRFIIGSAVPHDYPLSLGMYSVHTNPESLAKGEAKINELGNNPRLRDEL
jgi:redox-sensitive bicupin YhaK (pirin superfamily)